MTILKSYHEYDERGEAKLVVHLELDDRFEDDKILAFISNKDVKAYLIKGNVLGVYYAVVVSTGITQVFDNIDDAKAFYSDVKADIRAIH